MKLHLNNTWPIMDQDENAIFFTNGNFALAYHLELPEVFSQSEKDFEKIHSTWFQALKTLPAGVIVHKQDLYRKQEYDGARLPGNTFLAQATRSYFDKRKTLSHGSYLFFIWPWNKTYNKPVAANPFIGIPRAKVEKMQIAAATFSQAVREAVSYLDNSRVLKISPMNSEEVSLLTRNYFNGFNAGNLSDVVMDGHDLSIGEDHIEILSVNNELCFGEAVQTSRPNPRFTSEEVSFHQGFIDCLGLKIEQDHVVNQLIFLDDRNRWLGILNKKREELLKSIHFGTQNKVILEKIEGLLGTINRDDQARIVRGQTSIMCWDRDPLRLNTIIGGISADLKELDITCYRPKGGALYHYFLSGYFGFSSNFGESDLYVADLKHALCLWINNTNYRSDPVGVLFNDRLFNIPIVKDVWDEEKRRIKARNFAIFAPTGEGKSFLANNILRQFFEAGTRLVIIDLGGSYSKFPRLYPGEHVVLRYEPGKNLGINPFYIQETDDLGPQHVEDLVAFLLELSASGLEVAREKQVALKRIISHYYHEVNIAHSLEGFCSYVERNQEFFFTGLSIPVDYFDPAHFLHIMSEYRKGGMYGFLFENNRDQTYKLEDKRMIVFELDEVRDNREILSVMLKLIKSAIQRTIWRNRSERGIILFDEFAKQLKFENVLESVEFYYQAIRKQNGAIGIILQSINQLPENSTSASILENTQVIYSLHNEKGYGPLQRRLNLSAHDLNQLHSIRNQLSGKRKYTEIFIKIGRESNIYRLEVPPQVYAAYLTEGKDSEELMRLYDRYGSMEKAINHFINNNT